MEVAQGVRLPVAIPSKGRAASLYERTYRMLIDSGCKASQMTIFVSNADDFKTYSEQLPRSKVVQGPSGLAHISNFIDKYYPAGTMYVHAIDDVIGVKCLRAGSLCECQSLQFPLRLLYSQMLRTGASLAGFGPVANSMFMSHSVTTGLCLIMEGLCIIKASPELQVASHAKIHYERSILHWESCGKLCRLNGFALQAAYYKGNGGMSGRNSKTEVSAAKALKKRFSHYVSSVITKKNGTTSLRLRSLSQPAPRQTSAATAAAKRKRRSEVDHRNRPRCPKCHGPRTTIQKKADGRFYCTVCPCWFRVSAYAKRRLTVHKDRCAGRNMF